MAFKGMNPDEGREVATAINEAGSQIMDAIDAVTGVVNGVEWVGPDYDTYVEDWNGFVSGAVNGVVEACQAKSDERNQHAEEQDTTSNQG